MVGVSDRHAEVLNELVEWWQDLSRQQINSRAVLLPVPRGWGRTHLLDQLGAVVKDDDALSIVVPVHGASLPDGLGVQAMALRSLFRSASVEHRAAELLGVDRLGGVIQLSLGVAGLFLSALAAQVGLLLAGIGVGVAGKAWDTSPAGQEGPVAKLARAVAALSVSMPAVVIIDDADEIEPDLAIILIENLIERINGQVLVIAAVQPGGDLLTTLTSRAKYGLTEGRVRIVEADTDMDYQARVDLAAQLRPQLPAAVIRRIGQRARTFADVFVITAAERLAELDASGEDAAISTEVDQVIDALVSRAPSARAVALGWAGGIMHVRQVECATEILDLGLPDDDGDVLRFESLRRLADPASPRLAEQVRILTFERRHRLAETALAVAVEIGADPQAGLVDKVVAWQAAHRVRADLRDHSPLLGVQCQLVHGLEDLGDPTAAYQVAETALAEYAADHSAGQRTSEYDDLSAALLRLARARQPQHADPLIDATIAAVATGGAAVGLEARIWAAVDLLGQPDQRERGLELTDSITAELSNRNDLGAVGNRWRLLLAFHAGRAGYPAITQEILAPMLVATGHDEDEDAARAVLFAVDGPEADTRLQIIALEVELEEVPTSADDDRLRLHSALAKDYGRLGQWHRALDHAQAELQLRRRIQGPDHPAVLITRAEIARWTGEGGNPAEALQLNQQLLPDCERVFGHSHSTTLDTRNNIAHWTGVSGNPTEALRLFQQLLPEAQRSLGSNHSSAFTIRYNLAEWTGNCGDSEKALRLYQELLYDQVSALGSDHPKTLSTRSNTAAWAAESGRKAEALQLYQELLPDLQRVYGPDHPAILRIRSNIAEETGNCEDPEKALRLFRELLPDRQRVLGPDHPDTLRTRASVAAWIGECGNAEEALQLYNELLPDMQRVFGYDHPITLSTRFNIASLTAACRRLNDALRLFMELLVDYQRVVGNRHPIIGRIRQNILHLSMRTGSSNR